VQSQYGREHESKCSRRTPSVAGKSSGINLFPKPLRSPAIGDMLNFRLWQVSEKKRQSRWFWPWGLLATGLAGAGMMIFRGCWHSRMSWPVRAQEHSYQVCLGCGIKRLFDEEAFRAYGPYSYDLARLLSWDRARKADVLKAEPSEHRTAS